MNDAFLFVLEASVGGAAVAAVLLICRRVFRRKLSPQWSYAIWLLLVLRLIWPGHLDAPLPSVAASLPVESLRAAPLEGGHRAKPGPDGPIVASDRERPWREIGANAWLAGVVAILLYHGALHLRFAVRVRRSEAPPSQALLDVFRTAKSVAGAGAGVRLVVSDAVDGPTLSGALRPKLIVPAAEADKRMPSEWLHIFVHELAHERRKDIAVNAAAFVLLAAHWFNPLLWLAFRAMREDQELSCDARAIALLGPTERVPYGMTLLALAARRGVPGEGAVATAHFLRKRGALLRRRIEFLRGEAAPGRMWPVILVCGLSVLAGCAAITDEKRDPERVAAAYYQALSRLDYEEAYELDYHRFDDRGVPKEEWLRNLDVMYGLEDPRARSIQLNYKVGESRIEEGTVAVPVKVHFVRNFPKGSKYVVEAADEVHLREREGEWYIDYIVTDQLETKFYQEPF